METNRNVFDRRVFVLLVPALLVLAIDLPVLFTLLYSLCAMLVIVVAVHIVRRVQFPYVHLEALAAKAAETSEGAAWIYLSIAIVVSSCVIASAIWLHK